MEFKQIEHYDCFPDETIYWAGISDPPQEIQNRAREIDGEAYSPDCFGLCVFHKLSTHEFEVMTETAYPTGESGNIYYVDNDGDKHWFKADLSEDLLKEICDTCERITTGKMTERGYVVTDCVSFDDGHGYVLAEKADAKRPFAVLHTDVDECDRWNYSAERTFDSSEAARSDFSERVKLYEQFHSIVKPSLVGQLQAAKQEAAQRAAASPSHKPHDRDAR